MLEKIKRKVAADAQQVNGVSPAETVTQLHEVFSRFVKLKNLDKKTYVQYVGDCLHVLTDFFSGVCP